MLNPPLVLPYTFVNGTIIDAGQVNADFASLTTAVNIGTQIVLQTDTQFFVDGRTGNDNNTGLSPATAWQTLQGASNFISSFVNFNGVNVVINIYPGSYAGFAFGGAIPGQYSPGQLIFRGDINNPSSVVVGPGGNGNCVFVITTSMIQLEGMRFTNPSGTGWTGNALWVQGGAQLAWQFCDFGPCSPNGTHVIAEDYSLASAVGPYTISGGAGGHFFVGGQAQLNVGAVSGSPLPVAPFTVTVNNTPNFAPFIYCTGCSLADFGGASPGGGPPPIVTFSGPATGQRYVVNTCSVIQTYGGGANYFPGNAVGSADATTFGVYQ